MVLIEEAVTKVIVTVNSEFIVKSNEGYNRLREIITRSCATFDGQVPYLCARYLHRAKGIEKISGSDLIYDFANACAKNGWTLFFLGGKESSTRNAARVLREEYGISAGGYSPPFSDYPFSNEINHDILSAIAKFKPDILFVGFGAVKQEYWIDDNLDELIRCGVKFVVGSGGTVDFVSGQLRRAPKVFQILCLEGVYRLLGEFSWKRVERLWLSCRVFKYVYARRPHNGNEYSNAP
jgi:N-acetylglucosaminyldiphosphoundecaprenol N-acetyl-beta-D-mannosaminyltransferase